MMTPGVNRAPAHMNKASPVLNRTNKEAIQGKVPEGAGAAPIVFSLAQTMRPRRRRGTLKEKKTF
jgi:hypothetical protein